MAVLQKNAGESLTYEIVREGEDTVLQINAERAPFFPSLEESEICMERAITWLASNPGVTRIVFMQKRDYEYDYDQTRLLTEVAGVYNRLVRQRDIFDLKSFGLDQPHSREAEMRYTEFKNLVTNTLRKDPISAYVQAKRLIRHEHMEAKRGSETEQYYHQRYIVILESFTKFLEQTKLIQLASPYLAGFQVGSRDVYRKIFSPTMKPDFMFVRLMANFPPNGEELDSYDVNGTDVNIFRIPNQVRPLYHITPPEFKLSEDKYELLDYARQIISEHKPEESEFVDPERMRQVFSNVGRDLIEELADQRGLKLRSKEVEQLTQILIRYTVGFGLIEVLLQDEKVQDITVNSPMGRLPVFLVHDEYEDCSTNILPTVSEGESWATKFRLMSGRPLDEANPVLDTELFVPGARARVSVISKPLNPTGLAYAFRRHRDNPWTLPLFIANGMITPLAGGLLSFLIDGSRTFLIAGTRSAGKSSFLGALMTEIMRKYRMITIEDTLELPVPQLRGLGYNVQSMQVASALTRDSSEIAPDAGIRATLRLGDSGLIIGEVRSSEAIALYETMRIGALANVVAGTIHGDSPYGVFDRVVNDLKVPRTSFKATDIIVVANPIKSAGGLERKRRITQITEVGKFWQEDPQLENGFTDLMTYNSVTDTLDASSDLMNGESAVLKSIGGKVKEWAGSWDAIWDNIMLRTNIKEQLVKTAKESNQMRLLEADFVINSNDAFHIISERIKNEVGSYESKRIMTEWNAWLKRNV